MAILLEHSPYGFWMYKTLGSVRSAASSWRFRKRVKWLYGAVITVFAVYITIVIRSFLYMLLPGHPHRIEPSRHTGPPGLHGANIPRRGKSLSFCRQTAAPSRFRALSRRRTTNYRHSEFSPVC